MRQHAITTGPGWRDAAPVQADFLVVLLALGEAQAKTHRLEPGLVREIELAVGAQRIQITRAFPEGIGGKQPERAVRVHGRRGRRHIAGTTLPRVAGVEALARIDFETDSRVLEIRLGEGVRQESAAAPHLGVVRVGFGQLRIELEVQPVGRVPFDVQAQVFRGRICRACRCRACRRPDRKRRPNFRRCR